MILSNQPNSVNPFSEPTLPAIDSLPIGETKSMKTITIRTIETPAGIAYHVLVMEDAYTMTWTMTPAQLAEYLRNQANGHEAGARIVNQALAARQRRQQRGAA